MTQSAKKAETAKPSSKSPARGPAKSAPAKDGAAKAPTAFSKPKTPSADLAAIIGKDAVPRTEVVKKVWEYIKANGLQDASDKRVIKSDAKLLKVFDGKASVTMFEMNKHLAAHLS